MSADEKISADEESRRARYEALHRFAKETAEEADRLPDWKKPELSGLVQESSSVVGNSGKTPDPND
jgi:hypothetical protein